MKRHALLVGVNSYTNGIQPLSCATRDARELWKTFSNAGFAAELLTNEEASSADVVRARIHDFSIGLGRGDLFLLYFAGHGVFNSGRQLLLCANASYTACAEWQRKGGKTLPVGAIALDDIASDTAGECDRVFLFDMCRTHLQDGARDAAPMTAARDLSFGETLGACGSNWTYFFSCDEGQPALEVRAAQRGLFSLALSKVLNDRLEYERRLLLDEGFVREMEAEMRHVAETYGMDSCGQRPHRDSHGDTIVLFDPANAQPSSERPKRNMNELSADSLSTKVEDTPTLSNEADNQNTVSKNAPAADKDSRLTPIQSHKWIISNWTVELKWGLPGCDEKTLSFTLFETLGRYLYLLNGLGKYDDSDGKRQVFGRLPFRDSVWRALAGEGEAAKINRPSLTEEDVNALAKSGGMEELAREKGVWSVFKELETELGELKDDLLDYCIGNKIVPGNIPAMRAFALVVELSRNLKISRMECVA